MADDVVLAFSHPEARAGATRADGMRDRISLRDHIVAVDIGAFQPERGRAQRLCFNVVVEVADPGPVADDVDRILSYDRITEAIAAELSVERLNLLETLAERVAARVLAEPQARRIFVRIEKLDLGPGALGVEIVRTPRDLANLRRVDDRPLPVIVALSNRAIGSGRLPDWLDAMERRRVPVILAVGRPDTPTLRVDAAMPQRRIDLLAMEQNAWTLAARDARCVVVDSRTEIDWLRTQRGLCVWAPSKMVLDAIDGPTDLSLQGLVPWLARDLGVTRIVQDNGTAAIPGADVRAADCVDLLA